MTKSRKKQIRARFRNGVFERDRYECRLCGKAGRDRQGGDGQAKFHNSEVDLVDLDAHHITDRHDITNGGYVKENGISVCDECHELCETALQIERDSASQNNDGSQEVAQNLESPCECGLPRCVCGQPSDRSGYVPAVLYELIGSSLEKATKASEKL